MCEEDTPLEKRRDHKIKGILDPLSDPAPQLFGGGLSIGNHQNLTRFKPLFHQQAQIEQGNGVGLAGTGAGLNQMSA